MNALKYFHIYSPLQSKWRVLDLILKAFSIIAKEFERQKAYLFFLQGIYLHEKVTKHKCLQKDVSLIGPYASLCISCNFQTTLFDPFLVNYDCCILLVAHYLNTCLLEVSRWRDTNTESFWCKHNKLLKLKVFDAKSLKMGSLDTQTQQVVKTSNVQSICAIALH